jgi:hypothetical protein
MLLIQIKISVNLLLCRAGLDVEATLPVKDQQAKTLATAEQFA